MMSKLRRIFAARLVFIAGLFLMVLGIAFLLGLKKGSSQLTVFLAFLLVVSGALCAVFALKLHKRSYYLFFASFFLMAGCYLLLSVLGIISLSISRAWPLLSVFSGLALLPVGWRRNGGFCKRYLVSSCVFIILGCVLLVFSFHMVPFSFSQFIRTWWPLLLIFGGITLALISLAAKNDQGPQNKDRENKDRASGENTEEKDTLEQKD